MNHNPRAVLTAGTLARLGLHSFALYRTAALIITLYPAFQEVYRSAVVARDDAKSNERPEQMNRRR
jgi:hypothetical protein